MIPARSRAYVFLTIQDVEMLQRIGCYRASFDSTRVYLYRVVVQRCGKLFYRLREKRCWRISLQLEKNRGYAPQCRGFAWLESFICSFKGSHGTPGSAQFPNGESLELFRFVQPIFPGEEAFRAKEKRILWSQLPMLVFIQ